MSTFDCSLTSIRIESLRGFTNSTLRLDQDHLFLVGPNNSGKSSLLRILEWAVNKADSDLLTGRRYLTQAEKDLLLPAAETQGRARRITLHIAIPDGRRRRRFSAVSGEAQIRLKVKRDRVSAHLGAPKRNEQDTSDGLALELLRALRQRAHFVYVPNTRDVASAPFRAALIEQSRILLKEAMTPSGAGRHPAPVRAAQNSAEALRTQATKTLGQLEEQLTSHAAGLFDKASVTVPLRTEALVDLLADHAELRLSTGNHDSNLVPAHEVGSGLQSLLFVGLMRSASKSLDRRVVLLLEEPETFLHPAAQRELAQTLLDSDELKFVASTHSAAILDEVKASQVALLRDHRIYSPTALDPSRAAIDSAFMSGQGSEAIFARSVLLVEGPGDLAAFEQLRRRIARLEGMSRVASELAVVQVGGCERFSPWIRLLRGFVDATKSEGIAWFALADGDAGTKLRKGLREAKVTVPEGLSLEMDATKNSHTSRDVEAHQSAVARFNAMAEAAEVRAALLPFDLEYVLLAKASTDLAAACATHFNEPADTGQELAHRLGSTFRTPKSDSAPKADWMRGYIAQVTPWEDLHPEVRHVLRSWLRPALDGRPMPRALAGDC